MMSKKKKKEEKAEDKEQQNEGGKLDRRTTSKGGKDLVVDVEKAKSAQPKKKKPPCWWGSSCYQKNPAHLKRYDHTQSASPSPTAPSANTADQAKPLTQEEKQKAKAIEEKELSGFFDLDYMGADSETDDEQSGKWGFIASDNEEEDKKKLPSHTNKSSEHVTLSVSKEEWEKFLQQSKQSGLNLPKFTSTENPKDKNKRKRDDNAGNGKKKQKGEN